MRGIPARPTNLDAIQEEGSWIGAAALLPEALVPWRPVARRLANLAGEGDPSSGARALVRVGPGHPVLATFLRGVVRASPEGADAVRRCLLHELAALKFENAVGLRSARKLSPLRQEEASRLEETVQAALGRALADPERGLVRSAHVFHVLVARAEREARIPPKEPPVPPPPLLDSLARVIRRAIQQGNALLEAAGLSIRLALVPVDPPPTPGRSAGMAPPSLPQAGVGLPRSPEGAIPLLLRPTLVSPA